RRELFGKLPLVPRFVIQDRSFDVIFEVDDGGDADPSGPPPKRADAAAVIRAYQDGLPLVPLEGGGWAPLPHDWLSRFGDRVADLLAARRDEDKEVPTAALPALADLCDALEYPRPAAFERLAPLIEGFESLPEAALPADLTAELRPYQRRGVSWLVFLREAGLGAVLADDMGLGKTLQTLCALSGRTLVVCPRSVVHNWVDEIKRFRPALRPAIYHGPKRALDRAADVTLTTYAVLRLDAEILARENWDTVVLDEAQAIKNPDSQVARAAYDLRAGLRVALSGTPVENRLDELWSLLHFTNRGVLGGLRSFQERWARPIDAGVPGVAAGLRAKIRPFVLRRMKKDVAPELPPRSDAVLYCELEESERNVYEAVRAAARKDVVARLAEGSSVLAALEALLRLRQAACHPALIPGQTALTSSKIERLIESLEDAAADGHKALVFSQWTSLLDLVEPHLKEAGIAFTRLDGSTRDRGAVVADFQREAGPPVMLISLKAGGTGLNLTAADHVFLLDPWWNPAVEDQAEGRAHRIGQERPVMVYRLVAKDTVEEGILALQQRKRNLAEAALGEADQAGGITRDDLLALLQ
ncbi:MAG: DEAD/DEAH box helicase, partial [Byssovorax sp.]